MPFKVIVASGKDFTDYDLLSSKLDFLLQSKQPDIEIVTGFCLACDALANKYAEARNYPVKHFAGGFRHMAAMVKYANAAIIFHDGYSKGARMLMDDCQSANVHVKVVRYVAGPKVEKVRTKSGTGVVISPETPIGCNIPQYTITAIPANELDAAIPSGKPRPRKGAIIVDGEELIPKTKSPRKKKPAPAGDSTWKIRYQQAHEANFAKEYPSAHKDGHYIDPIYPKVRESNGMQTAIVNYLNWMGHRAKRINNMGRLVDGVDVTESGAKITAKKWIPSAAGKGQSDVSSTLWGKSVQLEIKAGNDKPSDYQLKEQAKERRAGGIYEFMYSIEGFFELYDKLFTLYGSSVGLFE